MLEERLVAGIRCSEVLAQLSAYVDGELTAPERSKIDAHIAECDLCERFGGEFAAALQALREQLTSGRPMDEGVRARLRRRLS